MPRRSIPAIVLALLLAACSMEGPEKYGAARPQTGEVARTATASGEVPSIAYAILRGGRIVETQVLGIADMETGALADESTLYEAASLTKQVVALLALQLVDAGVISLDEPVAPAVAAPRVRDRSRYSRVTPRQLLSHSAGFPNWSGDFLELDRNDWLDFEFEPGTGFEYSGEGYMLLGEFLEAKSGRTLKSLSEELFVSLGMSSSSLLGDGARDRAARGHFGRSPGRPARFLERAGPAFSLITNAADYGRFLAFVAAGGGLSPALLEESRRVQIGVPRTWLRGPRGPESLGWALGWGVLERRNDVVFFQWGDNGAFRAFAGFLPAPEGASGLVFFANGSRGLLETSALAAPVLGDISTAVGWFSSRPLEALRALVRF